MARHYPELIAELKEYLKMLSFFRVCRRDWLAPDVILSQKSEGLKPVTKADININGNASRHPR